jgi:hypothetical protein
MKSTPIVYLVILLVAICGFSAKADMNTYTNININDDTPLIDGMPFGEVSDQDITEFFDFAKTHGVDFESAMTEVYKTGSTNALGDVFKLSLRFTSLDQNARTYGQVVYSGFLNWGERGQVDFCDVMTAQPPNVQQRIRDFMFYVTLRCVPKEHRETVIKEIRGDYPELIPDGYVFGHDDPIFSKIIK